MTTRAGPGVGHAARPGQVRKERDRVVDHHIAEHMENERPASPGFRMPAPGRRKPAPAVPGSQESSEPAARSFRNPQAMRLEKALISETAVWEN